MRRIESVAPSEGFLSLGWDVAFARVLMWIANPTGDHPFQPQIHLYLADRYGLIAVACRRRGYARWAARWEETAKLHFHLGGGDDSPPAAAWPWPYRL